MKTEIGTFWLFPSALKSRSCRRFTRVDAD
jgi:hypothetical protein